MIVQTAIKYKANIWLIKDGANADAKSIMSVMMLAAACNSTVTIRATGNDEEDAVTAIASLFELKFKEE
jgi:phosphocarrier protein